MKQNFFTRALLLLATVCFGMFGAQAEQLQLNHDYTLNAVSDSYSFTYNPTVDGRLVIRTSAPLLLEWEAPITIDSEGNPKGPTMNYLTGYGHQIDVTAGTTYEFNVSSMNAPETFYFEFVDPNNVQLNIMQIYPAQNETFYLTGSTFGEVILHTDFIGKYDYVKVYKGINFSSEYHANPDVVPGNVIGVNIIEPITELCNRTGNKQLKPGDKFSVRIYGLKDVNGNAYPTNDKGYVSLSYVAAAMPLDLVSTTFGEDGRQVIYNKYGANATDGIFDFVFNGQIQANRNFVYETVDEATGERTPHPLVGPVAELSAVSDNDACVFYVPATVLPDGITVRVNLAGQEFGDFNGLEEYGISFKLMNLYGTDGQLVMGQRAQGNMGSYGYPVIYEHRAEGGQDPVEEGNALKVEPSEEVYAFNSITLTHSTGIVGFLGDDPDMIALTGPNGEKLEYDDYYDVDNGMCFTYPKMYSTPGVYTFTLPADFLELGNGNGNDAVEHHITVKALDLTTNPAVGNTIADQDAINRTIAFEGNTVAATGKGTPYIEGKSGVKVTVADNAFSWNTTLPDARYTFVFPAGSITVDGDEIPYDVRLEYTFGEVKPFSVTLAGPVAFREGGAYANTGNSPYRFEVVSRQEGPAILAFDLFDGPNWIYGGRIEEEGGVYTAHNTGSKLYVDHIYQAVISGYANEAAFNNRVYSKFASTEYIERINFTGTTLPYVYSDVTLVDVEPGNHTIIEPGTDHITLTFSGAVTVDTSKSMIIMPKGPDGEMFDPEKFTSATPNADRTVWTLGIDPEASYMTEHVDLLLAISVYDAQGRYLAGDETNEENSLTLLSFTINNGADMKALEVNPAAGAEVTDLSSIVLSNADFNLSYNYNYTGDRPAIRYAGKQVLLDYEADGEGGIVLTPRSDINYSGEITLYVPERLFVLDAKTGLGTYFNAGVNITYNHTSSAAPAVDASFDEILGHLDIAGQTHGGSVANSEVESLESLIFNFNEVRGVVAAEINAAVEDAIVLETVGSGVVKNWLPSAVKIVDNKLVLPIYKLAAGQHTLTIPAKLFRLVVDPTVKKAPALAPADQYSLYVPENAETIQFTTAKTTGLAALMVAEDGIYTVYNLMGVEVMKTTDASELRQLPAGLYIVNGQKVAIR